MPNVARTMSPVAVVAEMTEYAEEAATLLKSLGHPCRLLVLCLLSEGELTVGALNDRIALSQSALSQHLAVLRAEGLVETRREAQTIHYRISPGPALEIIRVLHAHFCTSTRPRARRRSTTGASR